MSRRANRTFARFFLWLMAVSVGLLLEGYLINASSVGLGDGDERVSFAQVEEVALGAAKDARTHLQVISEHVALVAKVWHSLSH